MLYHELFTKLENLYQESNFRSLSQQEFWKFVKDEYKQYCLAHTIEGEENQANFINYVMKKLFKTEKTPIAKEEVNELLLQAQKGNIEARNRLVEHNMGLVKSRALKFAGAGVPLADLIQEGAIGLMQAIEKFDVSKGCKLSTYAVPYIDGEITRLFYKQHSNVQLSINLSPKLTALKRLEEERGRFLTQEEVKKELKVSEESARLLMIHQQDAISLNAAVSEEQDTEVGYFIAASDQVEEQVCSTFMKSDVYLLLEYVNHREQHILAMLYGLDGEEIRSAPKVAEELGITSQRVYQIEANALKKMRRTKKVLEMIEYMDNPERAKANILYYRDKTENPDKYKQNGSNRPKEYIKR